MPTKTQKFYPFVAVQILKMENGKYEKNMIEVSHRSNSRALEMSHLNNMINDENLCLETFTQCCSEYKNMFRIEVFEIDIFDQKSSFSLR